MQVLNDWSIKGQVVHAEKASTSKQHHEAYDDWPSSHHSEHEPTIKMFNAYNSSI